MAIVNKRGKWMARRHKDNFWVAMIVLGVFVFFGVFAPHLESFASLNMHIEPDLTATHLSVTRTKISDSYTDTIILTVKSWYAGSGSFAIEMKDVTTPRIIAIANVESMSADQTRTFEAHYINAPDRYTLRIIIDKDNRVTEVDDESNNVVTRVVT